MYKPSFAYHVSVMCAVMQEQAMMQLRERKMNFICLQHRSGPCPSLKNLLWERWGLKRSIFFWVQIFFLVQNSGLFLIKDRIKSTITRILKISQKKTEELKNPFQNIAHLLGRFLFRRFWEFWTIIFQKLNIVKLIFHSFQNIA